MPPLWLFGRVSSKLGASTNWTPRKAKRECAPLHYPLTLPDMRKHRDLYTKGDPDALVFTTGTGSGMLYYLEQSTPGTEKK